MSAALASQPTNQTIDPPNYRFLQEHVHRESGIVLDSGKQYLVEARLMPIVIRRQLGTVNDLCACMRSWDQRALRWEVVEAMTTNETQFFRDVDLWQGLRTKVLPETVERRRSTRTLRLWSAAASSGQEAYSLAIELLEMGLGSWDIQILGTDLSEQILERARLAKYSQMEVGRGLPAKHLVKYFVREGMLWQLKEEVRRMVRFEQLDLRGALLGTGPFDLVLCRNVLIYFDVPTKRKILQRLRGAMFQQGYLALGSAETTFNLDGSFESVSVGRTSFYLAP
jgi:chemotaxis protein methyltransferase CheR